MGAQAVRLGIADELFLHGIELHRATEFPGDGGGVAGPIRLAHDRAVRRGLARDHTQSKKFRVCPTGWMPVVLNTTLLFHPTKDDHYLFLADITLLGGSAETNQWEPAKDCFIYSETNQATWYSPDAGPTNREFLLHGWFDCDNRGVYSNIYPHRDVKVRVVELDKLTLTALPGNYAVSDVTRTDEPVTASNTLYLAEGTNGMVQMKIEASWLPPAIPAERFRYEILQLNGSTSAQWQASSGAFNQGPVTVTWTNAAQGESNRSFKVNAWYDCNHDGTNDVDEPHRQLFVVVPKVDLDVNNNTFLGDAVDGAINYLPGYVGTPPSNYVARLSTGTGFESPGYTGQCMCLVAKDLGLDSGVDELLFEVKTVSTLPGFCEDATDARITGTGKEHDYSFHPEHDEDAINIKILSVASDTYGGQMERDRSWVRFWCKDYGGYCEVIVTAKRNGCVVFVTQSLRIPQHNGDGIADIYKRNQLQEWKRQFAKGNDFDTDNIAFFAADDDSEEIDADGTNNGDGGRNLPDHAAIGDGLKVRQEYRGYILDGGPNGFAGGHKRLSAARKELLVEAIEMPGVSANQVLAPVAQFYNDVNKGCGIDAYWAKHAPNLGEKITYTNGQTRAHAYYHEGYLRYIGTRNEGENGSVYIYRDRRLERENPPWAGRIYRSKFNKAAGQQNQMALQRNRSLKVFVKLLLVSHWGYIDRQEAVIQPIISKTDHAICYYDPDHLEIYNGSRIDVFGIAEEGPFVPSVGRPYTAHEFQNILTWSVVHELGHLIIRIQDGGNWTGGHYRNPQAVMTITNPGTEGINAVHFLNEEIERINLQNRASVEK